MIQIPQEENINKLKLARDKVADVYKDEATDDINDNGNLSILNGAIGSINNVIEALIKRGQ